MRQAQAALGSLAFLILAPGTVAGLVPWWLTGWRLGPALFGFEPLRWLGGVLVGLSLALLLECFGRFAWLGRGTPAPVAPTERLVVSGPYRRVRNPMYVAVTGLILGQVLMFQSAALLVYAAAIVAAFHAFVLAYEEPTLKRQFPADYPAYFANVPRWVPRLRAWRP